MEQKLQLKESGNGQMARPFGFSSIGHIFGLQDHYAFYE